MFENKILNETLHLFYIIAILAIFQFLHDNNLIEKYL